jgi:hypothetical protein
MTLTTKIHCSRQYLCGGSPDFFLISIFGLLKWSPTTLWIWNSRNLRHPVYATFCTRYRILSFNLVQKDLNFKVESSFPKYIPLTRVPNVRQHFSTRYETLNILQIAWRYKTVSFVSFVTAFAVYTKSFRWKTSIFNSRDKQRIFLICVIWISAIERCGNETVGCKAQCQRKHEWARKKINKRAYAIKNLILRNVLYGKIDNLPDFVCCFGGVVSSCISQSGLYSLEIIFP